MLYLTVHCTSAGAVDEVWIKAFVRQRTNFLDVVLTHELHKCLQIRLQTKHSTLQHQHL